MQTYYESGDKVIMNTKICYLCITVTLILVVIIALITNRNLLKENKQLREKVSGTKVVLNTCPCCGSDNAYLHMVSEYYYIVCDKCHYKTTGYSNLNELINEWNGNK